MLQGRPPIRVVAVELPGIQRSERGQHRLSQAAVEIELEIEEIVPLRVGAQPHDLLAERTVDHRARTGRGRKEGMSEWKAPDRRRVPQILNRRIIIERKAPDQVLAGQRGRIRIAKIEIAPGVCVTYAAIERLRKDAGMLGQCAGIEQRGLVQRRVVVRTEAGRRLGVLVCRSMSEGKLCEHGKRNVVATVVEGIAGQLELAPEGGELRSEGADMACGAWLSGLLGKARNRSRRVSE